MSDLSSHPCDSQNITGLKRCVDGLDTKNTTQFKKLKCEDANEAESSVSSLPICELDGNLNYRPVNRQQVKKNISVNIKTKMVIKKMVVPEPQPIVHIKEEEPITSPKHVKPELRNARLQVLKPVSRSHELSGLCSIM